MKYIRGVLKKRLFKFCALCIFDFYLFYWYICLEHMLRLSDIFFSFDRYEDFAVEKEKNQRNCFKICVKNKMESFKVLEMVTVTSVESTVENSTTL